MTGPATRRITLSLIVILLLSFVGIAQPETFPPVKENKPYRILTSGKQVTVKSSKLIKNIMVWTATGHRIVEQRDLNVSSYSFNATMNQRVLFIMIQYEGLKPYTEKIGLRE